MNNPTTPSVNTQKIEETEKFFNQWRIYQQIIHKNYMVHQQIITAYQQFIENNITQKFSVLDLGCGDAFLAVQLLKQSAATHYTGIDVSTTALQQAKTNFNDINIEKQFICNDLSDAIRNSGKQFDIVLAGYSIHHLKSSEKNTFFAHCYSTLKPDGHLLMYDIISEAGETREQCLQRHWNIYNQWDLDESDKRLVKEHIFAQDYAESLGQLKAFALKQGFTKTECLFTDANKLFSAFSFQK